MALFLPALLYLAAAVFLTGMSWRLWKWGRAPAPLKIVLTPAPKTSLGVARRLAEEFLGFRSLFNASRLFWVPAWLFHVSLLLLLIGHIGGLVVPGLAESALGISENQFERFAQITGCAVGLVAIGCVITLLIWRIASERSRYISTGSDYLALLLLLLVIATGDQMRFMNRLDIIQARQFVSGWLTFHPMAPPANSCFVAHVLLVSALLINIPFSKLVHLGGATFFSPTLNTRNNPRQQRHAGPWPATHERTAP